MQYGVMPPKVDVRDYKVKSVAPMELGEVELLNLPKIKNQGQVNSCAAHAASSILEWFNQRETGEYRELSTDFIYGMQGVKLGRMDSGMYLRDVCKIVKEYGDCTKETIPLNREMPECAEKLAKNLTDEVLQEAAICKVKSYAKCESDDDVKYAILNYGGVLASVKWYNKYKVKDGIIQFDTTQDHGYHAVMVYGFCDKGWKCINSWGNLWGDFGKFILPYEYGFREAWSFVDAENEDIHKPKRNNWLDLIYKIINLILNLWKR